MSRDRAGGDRGPARALRELYCRGSGPGAPARPPSCRTFPFPASRSPSSVSRKRHIDPRAFPPSAPRRAPQATHLGHGLPVAGHRLLDEAENFHSAISARHDHPGPPEAHGHFHAAVPRCPWPERRWAGRLYAGRGGAAAPARRRLGARAGGRTELPGYHVQPGRLRLASPVHARAPAASGHLFVVSASWRARRRPGAVWRSRSVGTPRRGRRGREEEQQRAGRTAPRAGGRRRRRAGRPEASAAAGPLGSPHGDARRSPRRCAWASAGQGASSSSPLAVGCSRRPTPGRPTHAPRGIQRGPLPFFVTFNPLPGRKQFKLGDAFRTQEPPSRAGEDRKLQARSLSAGGKAGFSILSAWLRCKTGRRCSVAEINWLLPREVGDAWTPWYFLLRPLFTLKFLSDPLV